MISKDIITKIETITIEENKIKGEIFNAKK
jgi:hypothetical protein